MTEHLSVFHQSWPLNGYANIWGHFCPLSCLFKQFNIHTPLEKQEYTLLTQTGIHTHTSDILIIDRSTQSSRQSPITRKIIWVSTSISGLGNRISPSYSLFSLSLSVSIPHFCLRLAGKTMGFFILKTCLKNGPLSTRASTKSGPSGSPVISVTAISLNQACSACINFSHEN